MATGGINLSKEFFELIKAIGESKSKQEEDRIIQREVATLKQKLERPSTPTTGGSSSSGVLSETLWSSKKRAKEFLVRLLYVEMLGHDASFGYIKAVELAASASLYHKRTGYLVCGACLPPTHEFRFMLVNQMQRDLASTNVLEVTGGVLACCTLITSDMVPAVSTPLQQLLQHEHAAIRKKAIIAYHRLYQLAPDVVTAQDILNRIRKAICDKDPAVMGASLNVLEAMARTEPTVYKDLIPSLVSILKQIGEHRLPSEFDYHRVPAPWMQLKLIRILGLLGQADAQASSGMYEILSETLKKADVGINAGYAIVYECVKTIVHIYPNPTLLDAAGTAISRFMQSPSHNLKYLGVTGLSLIVETHPQYAAQHQIAVLDCLEDPDTTLARKTLHLLYRMTNPVNVEFITEKLLDYLQNNTDDEFLLQWLTTRICNIAERYAPNNAWYIRTITQLFQISGDCVPWNIAQNLMTLMAEGTGETDEDDMLLRQNAVEIYVQLLLETETVTTLSKILLETMAWCLGEYAYLSVQSNLTDVLQKLTTWLQGQGSRLEPSTRKCLMTAICKLIAQAGTCPPQAAHVIDLYTKSSDVDLQQRALEFQHLLTMAPQTLGQVLPVDASAEDLQVDASLGFLNSYIQTALAQGAPAYDEKMQDDDDDEDDYTMAPPESKASGKFNMTPYAEPQAPTRMPMRGTPGVTPPPGGDGGSMVSAAAVPDAGGLTLNTRNVANVWGKGGMTTKTTTASAAPAPAAPPAPAPAAASAWGDVRTSSSSGFGAPPAPEKTPEQLEKERMAAALFGGMIPGQKPPTPTAASAPVAAPPPPPPTNKPTPPPKPTPTPAPPPPEVDLLDMSDFEMTAAPAPPPPTDFDIFAPPPASTTPPAVETVSSDEEEPAVVEEEPPKEPDDPFAAEGLLGSVQDKPLASLMTTSPKFEYNGTPMGPLAITTPQFGEKWGTCSATSPLSMLSAKITNLDSFMDLCANVGCHKVEAIPTTNEGICAGMVGSSGIVLIHGKVTPSGGGMLQVDATVKSTDPSLSGALALYLQTKMR